MIGLGSDGITMASHLVMIAVLVSMVVRIILAPLGDAFVLASRRYGLTLAIALGLSALAIERGYYVIARYLKREGVDLWAMHPAPEVLALLVTFGLYLSTIPIVLAKTPNLLTACRRVGLEACAILFLWATLAWVLY